MVQEYINHWDVTRGDYQLCDRDKETRKTFNASAGRIVVVSQFRVRQWVGENYKCEMYSLQNLSKTFHRRMSLPANKPEHVHFIMLQTFLRLYIFIEFHSLL